MSYAEAKSRLEQALGRLAAAGESVEGETIIEAVFGPDLR
jgi:hypothetical protein